MASYNDARSVNATFSSTTADTALLTNFWDQITVRNLDGTNAMYVRFDGTTPTAGQEGAYLVGPGATQVFNIGIKNENGIPGSTTAATACHWVTCVGNGGSYGISGGTSSNVPAGAGAAGVNSTGTASGSWTVTDGTSSHGKIVQTVGTTFGQPSQSLQIFKDAADAQAVLNFFYLGAFGLQGLQTGPGGSTAPTTVEFNKVISVSTTNAGTTDGTEADLYTDTLAAGLLAADNQAVEARYAGTVASTGGTTKRVRVYFGGTVIWDSAALTIASGGFWSVEVLVTRVSATAVDVWAIGTVSGPTTSVAQPQLVATVTGLTLANAQIIKVTGQSAGGSPAANDVVGTNKRVRFLPAG